MAPPTDENLLARLARGDADGDDSFLSLTASEPEYEEQEDEQLNELLSRINKIADSPDGSRASAAVVEAPDLDDLFVPVEPESFAEAGLTETEVEALALKYLMARGDASGHEIADQIRLPFVLVDELLRQLKIDQLVVHKHAAPMNDYQYQLSDVGRERARRYHEQCSYSGSAPVTLQDYVTGVEAQSLAGQRPTAEAMHAAFEDLLLNKKMLDKLGPAVNSGRGLFLFGPPGNGKTSIAERVTAVFGKHIWIPRCVGVEGTIIRVFDPLNHVEVPVDECSGLIDQRKIDKRWARIERPTIIAGGELTMSALEVTIENATGICEAPLQMKSNCGTLVIDDFGRQRMPVDELLNRWIVPLEKRFDFLSIPGGKKICVPFDQLIVFSTNLEPRDLVDEAFLRRIPYKIEAIDPSEEEFRELFRMFAPKLGLEHDEAAIDYLIEKHYRAADRPFRFCHPRDLLLQVYNYCTYQQSPLALSPERLDEACENYFSVM
jgi:hypothetical protein